MLAGKVRMSAKSTTIFGTNTLASASPGRETLPSVKVPADVGQTSLRARPQQPPPGPQLIKRTPRHPRMPHPRPPPLPADKLRLLIDLLCLSSPRHQFISLGTGCKPDSKTANVRRIFPLDIPILFRGIFLPFFTSLPASPRQS